ncbi:polyphenol oxidase family protein [Leptospira sp. WS39.C2]
MRSEISLPYGKVRFGTFGKKECSFGKEDQRIFPKSAIEWFSYTKEIILKQFDDPSLQVHSLNQIHGDTIQYVDGISFGLNGEKVFDGDGLFSFVSKQILVVRTADCVPVFLYSTKRPLVSIIHSGWKGTKLGITETMIEILLAKGFTLDELRIEIGPYIQRSDYEVGEDVAQYFKDLGKEVCLPKQDGKYFLDVGLTIEKRVKHKFGERVVILNEHSNVFQSPLYFSHRAKEEGRNLNFILWES